MMSTVISAALTVVDYKETEHKQIEKKIALYDR